MSILAAYRVSGPVGPSSNISFPRIQPVIGLKPSGNTNNILAGVGLYVWSGTSNYDTGNWIPLKREWL